MSAVIFEYEGFTIEGKTRFPGVVSRHANRIVFGECFGSVWGGNTKGSEDTVELLTTAADFRPGLINSVGDIAVVEGNNKGFLMCLSHGSAGLYFTFDKTSLRFWDTEGEAFLDLGSTPIVPDPDEAERMVKSHQLLTRRPFSSFLKGLYRLPPGYGLRADLSNGKLDFFSLSGFQITDPKEKQADLDSLFQGLSGVMKLYRDNFEELKLLFSGGLDSSLLLAVANTAGIRADNVEFRLNTIDYPYVDEVARSLGHLVDKKGNSAPEEGVRDPAWLFEACKAGMGTVAAETQFFFDWLQERRGRERPGTLANITGQNADTLYMLDTFAPGTHEYGLRRVLSLLETARKRLLLSRVVLGSKSSSLWRRVLVSVLCFPQKPRYFSNLLLAKNLFSGSREHVQPFREGSDAILGLKSARDFELACKSHNLMPEELDSLRYREFLFFLKSLRWLRTVQNSHVFFLHRSRLSGARYCHPFSEGPVANFLLGFTPSRRDILSPKHLESKLFKRLTGLSFRRLVARSISSSGGFADWRASESFAAREGRTELVRVIAKVEAAFPVDAFPSLSKTVQEILETRKWERADLGRHELARIFNWRAFELQARFGIELAYPTASKN